MKNKQKAAVLNKELLLGSLKIMSMIKSSKD
jgi:hypothetical protein